MREGPTKLPLEIIEKSFQGWYTFLPQELKLLEKMFDQCYQEIDLSVKHFYVSSYLVRTKLDISEYLVYKTNECTLFKITTSIRIFLSQRFFMNSSFFLTGETIFTPFYNQFECLEALRAFGEAFITPTL